MAHQNNSGKSGTVHKIPFQDNNYRLTKESLEKYTDALSRNKRDWRWPILKFLSFQQGQLTLLNTCKERSFKLKLQVKDNDLFISCNCDHNKPTLCEHAYGALCTLLWHLGECYFEKLQPGGTITLALAHKSYFDKKESTAGINVSPRPELKSVFRLAPEVEHIDLPAILQLPVPTNSVETLQSDSVLSYLVTIPFRNRLIPALLPCLGRLNKSRTEIKSWDHFLTGVQKQYEPVLTDSQKELNIACYHLWKIVETTPGSIIKGILKKEGDSRLTDIFNAWQKILPSLQKQPFVYTYLLYGIRELKNKPAKRKIEKVVISEQAPSVAFVLLDKGAFYQFHMQVRVNGKLLPHYDAAATFFVQHHQTLYMLSSLRDAALAEWLYRSGGWITVFKEHFALFEQEVLKLLRENYTIEVTASKRKQ